MHLLVVDDERGISTFISFVARDRGWTASAAATAMAFRAAFIEEPPDVIVLDLQLGSSDGVEQLRFLADKGFSGKLILVSGFDRRVLAAAEQRAQSLGLAVTATETKPLRVKRLHEILELAETALNAQPDKAAQVSASAMPTIFEPAAIGEGIAAGQMEIHFQPILSSEGRRASHIEALTRWRHPTFGMVPPDRFIPAAESDPAVIDRLTAWLIGAVIDRHKALSAAGHAVRISVNLSAVNLHTLSFPDEIAARLSEAGISCSDIALELTESAAVSNLDEMVDILTRLRLKGFQLMMDDFGIGYSSLHFLRQLPFSVIKLDRSFVSDINASEDSFAIVKSVVDLAHQMGLETVAEGVENEEAAELLSRMGVTGLQGYFFSRPLPYPEIADWLAASAGSKTTAATASIARLA